MATPQELRSLYLAVSKRLHPDLGGSTEQMQKVSAAWDAIQSQGAAPSTRWLATEAHVSARAKKIKAEGDEVFADIAEQWNKRLAKCGIQALVVPASVGLFTVSLFDMREDEVGTALHDKLLENESF